MSIINIFNQKGGVGKTTFALNIATYLSIIKNKKVLFIDNDGQASSTYILSAGMSDDYFIQNNSNTIENLFLTKKNIDSFILKSKFKNIDYIPSCIDHVYTDLNLKNNKLDIISNKLINIKDDYDYIIIDNPPAMSNTVLNFLHASDVILAPIESCVFSVRGLLNLINLVSDLNKNNTVKFFCFLSKVDNRKVTKNTDVKNILFENLGDSFLRNMQISYLAAYQNTLDNYETIASNKSKDKTYSEIESFGEFIVKKGL